MVKEDVTSEKGMGIIGYVDRDGVLHKMSANAKLEEDEIVLIGKGRTSWGESPQPLQGTQRLPRSDVQALVIEEFSGEKTALLGGAVVLVLGIAVAVVAASSCPFVYSWDGTAWVLDGEPFGGAVSRGLARTDWSELEAVDADRGEYRVRLGNEMDETQYVDAIELVVVDHEPGTAVVMDASGRAHAFRRQAPLVAARDGNGVDLRAWMAAADHAAWYPDLAVHAAAPAPTSPRDRIELAFTRPEGADRVWLVARAATGPWGAYMMRTLLGLHGDRVGEHYEALDTNPWYRAGMHAWVEREQLFRLDVQVLQGNDWQKQGALHGSGPIVAETRALPLDLGAVDGNEVRIRVEPPAGFWTLDFFQLAWDEIEVQELRVPLRRAVDEAGRDVAALLQGKDGNALVLATHESMATLAFAAPPLADGKERHVFAATHGWYEIHLHRQGPRDDAAIARLRDEPGAAARVALDAYREFERTGKLRDLHPDLQTLGGR
jgi:hypothetical protein